MVLAKDCHFVSDFEFFSQIVTVRFVHIQYPGPNVKFYIRKKFVKSNYIFRKMLSFRNLLFSKI